MYLGDFMNNNAELDLDLDIKYIKKIITKSSGFSNKLLCKLMETDKVIMSRIHFVCFQFRNIFNNGLWL